MCGCDYTTSIHNVGPIKALTYLHAGDGTIENVIKRIERYNQNPWKAKKYRIPENFFFKEARELFKQPNVEKDKEKLTSSIKWLKPDEEGLKDFLIT